MTYDEFLKQHNVSLNEQQSAAVQAINGPTLLLAVPGSGKTTVLVTRIGYMIYCCNIDPRSILTVTYTKAAAEDMKKNGAKSIFQTRTALRLIPKSIYAARFLVKYELI